MEEINYLYLIGGIIFIIIGIFFFRDINKDIKREKEKNEPKSLFDWSLDFKGYVGAVGAISCGIVMVFREIIKFF